MQINVNFLAVIIAAVASMVLGFLWYSATLFGKQWMALTGRTMEGIKKEQKEMGKLYGLSFLLALITAYVLSHVMALSMNFFHYTPVSTGLSSAFWMWLGFVLPVQTAGEIFGEKKWKLLGINTGYQLASLLLMGVILGLF